MSDIESLKFPNPRDYWVLEEELAGTIFKHEDFNEDYESCLVELGLIIENTYDPVLRKKLEDLMRDVPEWLK